MPKKEKDEAKGFILTEKKVKNLEELRIGFKEEIEENNLFLGASLTYLFFVLSAILTDLLENYTGAILLLTAMLLLWHVMGKRKGIRRKYEQAHEHMSTSERFGELSELLKTASSRIKEMEYEIEDKRRSIEELDELGKKLDALASLREEQVNVVKEELNSIMTKSARKNRIWTIIIGAIWFIIGLIVRGLLGF